MVLIDGNVYLWVLNTSVIYTKQFERLSTLGIINERLGINKSLVVNAYIIYT